MVESEHGEQLGEEEQLEDGRNEDEHVVDSGDGEQRDEGELAIDEYEAAIDLDPDAWRPKFHLGQLCFGVGMVSEAHKYFMQVLQANPEHGPTLAIMEKLTNVDLVELELSLIADDGDGDNESEIPPLPFGDVDLLS